MVLANRTLSQNGDSSVPWIWWPMVTWWGGTVPPQLGRHSSFQAGHILDQGKWRYETVGFVAFRTCKTQLWRLQGSIDWLVDWLNDNDEFEFAPFSLDRLVDSLTRGWFFRLQEHLSPFIFWVFARHCDLLTMVFLSSTHIHPLFQSLPPFFAPPA